VVEKRRAPVFLVGFMGAGKTTIGRALGRLLGREFVDLDARIVEEDGRDIPRILQESGEPYFRALETRILAGLRGRPALVVACGGGTYANPASHALIDGLGTAIWLQAPLAVMLARCGGDTGGRPLLGGLEEARALYLSRLPAYRTAPVQIDVDGLTPEEAAERIAARL
jgi:shikimate kinase